MGKKKKSANRIPKHIAGVKVPKQLRKAGTKAIELAESPAISGIVAAGLLAAAASLMEDRPPPVKRKPGEAGSSGRKTGVHDAVRAAAGAMGSRFVEEMEEVIGVSGLRRRSGSAGDASS